MHSLVRGLRLLIAGVALLLTLGAFAWVAIRPWYQQRERGSRVRLTVMHWSGGGGPDEDRIVETMIADFKRRHPGVEVVRINPGDTGSYYTKLQTMFAAGTPPDVFYMGADRLASFAMRGLLAELDPLLAADRAAGRETLDLDDFFSATLDCFRFDGHQTGRGRLYGIPKDFTTIGFYYNKDLFDAAGVPYPRDDWTWDDFHEAARRLGALPGVTGAEFVTWPFVLRTYLWTWGTDVCSPDFSQSWLKKPETYAALERIRRWRFDEPHTLTSGKSQVAQGESVFLTGTVGMAGPFGRWVVPQYRHIEKFRWDFAPLPRGTRKANVVLTVSWSIAARSRHKQLAWELVKSLTGPGGQAAMARLGLAIPTLKSVAYSDAFIDPSIPPANDRAFLSQVPYARPMPWPVDPRFEHRMGSRLEQALRTGDLTLDEAIEKLEADWAADRASPLNRTDFPRMPWRTIVLVIAAALGLTALLVLPIWWRTRPGRIGLREELAGYAFVSPWVVGFAVFMAFPIVLSLLLAFCKWSGLTTLDAAQWVGPANFQQLFFHDPRFAASLRVTAYYAAVAVPAGQLVALLAALLLAQDVKFVGFFRSAWYLPTVLAGVAIAVLWRWVFDGDHGLMNTYLLGPLLRPLGLRPPQWFDEDARWAGPLAFAIMSLWGFGGPMVIYLAGIKGIPAELHEAASLDGAGALRRLRHVTLPMLSPVIFFNVIMAIIGSFQVFTQAYVMTGGGPGDATRFYVLYLYNQAFEFHEMGYASAMAWMLLVIILLLTLLIMRGSRRYVYYEALR